MDKAMVMCTVSLTASLSVVAAGLPAMLAASSTMTGVFVVSLIVGGGLVAISTLVGGDADADVDPDFGGDFQSNFDSDVAVGADVAVDADVDAELAGGEAVGDAAAAGHGGGSALSLTEWFSIRFLVYFLAAFGLIGTVLSFTSQMAGGAVLAVAVIGGLVVGQGVHQLLRALNRSSGDSSTTAQDFLNRVGRVTVAIGPHGRGQVAVAIRGRERFVTCEGKRRDDQFSAGDSVAIVAYRNGVAQVVSHEEYEFTSGTASGSTS